MNGRECHLVMQYWADLQSVHGLRCYDDITRTRNVSEYMLVLALCLVILYRCLHVSKEPTNKKLKAFTVVSRGLCHCLPSKLNKWSKNFYERPHHVVVFVVKI